MSLAFHRLQRRIREASDDGRTPAGAVQLLRGFTESHPDDEDGWKLLTRTLHDLGRDGEADQAATRGLVAGPASTAPKDVGSSPFGSLTSTDGED
jgi:predicted Zn-dependent protease